jgi:formylglycine-generating enzyme required for sulfatase activity/tRNA A-37 threonylcarbamoyl transferase component Bud32
MADPQDIARQYNIPPEALRALIEALQGERGARTGTIPLEDLLEPDSPSAPPAMSLSPAPAVEVITVRGLSSGESRPRYRRLGPLGMGGMGEVSRVWDEELKRTVAMKVLRAALADQPALLARFVEEAQIGAQLQHPGIVPVYEVGRLEDGRLYFTMQEIHGEVLHERIAALHAGQGEVDGTALRALLGLFLRACEAVAYAHKHGVLHRDLKPSNIMIGGSGEVFVVDWGLAKVVQEAAHPAAAPVITQRTGTDDFQTRVGRVAGTPAYMAPEQARGELAQADPRADVYALGGILHHILTGAAPRRDGEALPRLGQGALPGPLRALCARALALEPADRHPHAGALADELRDWLDGTRRRELAQAALSQADALERRALALQEEAQALALRARAALERVAPWAPEEEKAPGWALQEEAERLEREAATLTLEANERLREALLQAPDWAEPRARLAAHHARALLDAERRGHREEARRHEFHLRQSAEALPDAHPRRPEMFAVLRGIGALTLLTDPPGAEVHLSRYVLRRRRLHAEPVGALGRTPLRALPLEPGSYLLHLRAPGRAEVRYPILIERQHHWDGVRPGDRDPTPILLPAQGELLPDEVYVPAGWFMAGDDSDEDASLPRCRLWADPFVLSRHHITHAQYIDFINDLVTTGRRAEALEHVPRERSVLDPLSREAPLYEEQADQTFRLPPNSAMGIWGPDRPVLMINWFSACAYAAWQAARRGEPWRLVGDLEWEKTARGVDGRIYPWGDFSDPSWCRIAGTQEGFRRPTYVGAYPVDESPYGARDLVGNAITWCQDPFSPKVSPAPVVTVPAVDMARVNLAQERCNRGGSWVTDALYGRAPRRSGHVPFITSVVIGFRVARSYGPGACRSSTMDLHSRGLEP